MTSQRTPTLAGRILRGILTGVVDGLPLVSQVVNTVRQAKAERAAAEPVPTAEPVTRTLTGWLTLAGVVASVATGLAGGVLDCEGLTRVLQFFNVLP